MVAVVGVEVNEEERQFWMEREYCGMNEVTSQNVLETRAHAIKYVWPVAPIHDKTVGPWFAVPCYYSKVEIKIECCHTCTYKTGKFSNF